MRLGVQALLLKWVLFAGEWKMISILKAEHLPSFWYRGPGELGNGLFRVIDSDWQPFGGMGAFRLQYSARCNLFRQHIFNSRPTGINLFEEFSWTTSYKAPSTQIQTFLNPHNLTRTLKSNLVSTVLRLFGQRVVDFGTYVMYLQSNKLIT